MHLALKRKKKVNVLIAVVLFVVGLACVVYPSWLWVEGKLEQRRLDQAFESSVQEPASQDVPGYDEAGSIPQWTEFPPTKINIPSLQVDVHVVSVDDLAIFSDRLNHPPGYYPTSRYPGEVGNVTIAGHRGGPAGYFLDVDKLEPGEIIILETPKVSFTYEVERVFVTDPTDFSVV